MTKIVHPTAAELEKRLQWLNDRRFTPDGGFRVTASDVAAILGWHPDRTALDVYVTKITGREIQDTPAMRRGRFFESAIANLYAELTGRKVANPGDTALFVHPDLPWLGATPDREIWEIGEEGLPGSPLEIKHVGSYNKRQWKYGAPMWVEIQLRIQMACMNATWGAYCGVIGGDEEKFGDIDRSDAFIESTIPRLEEFIWQCNERVAPEVTAPRDLEPIKALYPNDNGETVVLSVADMENADRWEQAKEDRKKSEDERKTREAKIRSVIGDATFGLLPDDTILTLRTTVRKDGSSYRTLRRD